MTRRIAFVVFPDFQILDVTGPIAAFEIAARFASGAYALRVMSATPGLVASSSGASLFAGALTDPAGFDTVLFAGGDGTRRAAADPAVLAYARAADPASGRIASVCSGAYILAEAGLLNGRRATTHWQRSDDFMRRYPNVRLQPDRIWIKDGKIWTSAGITAGIDLALAMIAEDFGDGVARATARQLVVYHRRSGGQSQFSALLEMQGAEGRFSPVLAWARENLGGVLSVQRLADRAAMSPRNFARAFVRETGVTPAKAMERLRLETARARIEAPVASMETIARETGFGDPERMRRAFVRAFGQPPQALRRAARSGAV